MLNIDSLDSGIVIDHIKAGSSIKIYRYLRLDQLDRCVAIIKNAKSNKYGKKDIIKIEGITEINTDILGFIHHNITVNVIKDGVIAEKKAIGLPNEIHNVIKCKKSRDALRQWRRASSRCSASVTGNGICTAVFTASRNLSADLVCEQRVRIRM